MGCTERQLADQFVLMIPLQIQKGTEIAVVKLGVGFCSDDWLGAIGHAETGGLDHGQIIGTITHCQSRVTGNFLGGAEF